MKKYPDTPLLIVDDFPGDLQAMKRALSMHNITNVILCEDSREVMGYLENQSISLVILDLGMPYISGEELLKQIKASFPDVYVIIATASTDLRQAIQCIKEGAYDFLIKPVDVDLLLKSVDRILEIINLKKENSHLRDSLLSKGLQNPRIFKDIITQNSDMYSKFKYTEAISCSKEPVLVTGENGVGKELIVKALHDLSNCNGELVSVNVSGLDDTMFADTIFGHIKGAYTGAAADRKGMISKASDGTLFLDEIGDISFVSQAKLLRLIQEKEYSPLGSDNVLRSNARIILATNKDIKSLIDQGQFKPDLYHRLNIHNIHIPPLRERMEDIPILTDFFITSVCKEYNWPEAKKPILSDELIELFRHYSFPGNIRELRNIIKDALFVYNSGLSFENAIKEKLDKKYITREPNIQIEDRNNFGSLLIPGRIPTLKEADALIIKEALSRNNGIITRAAKVLGITQQGLSKRIKQFKEEGIL